MRRVPGEKGVLSSAMILTMVVSAVLLPGQVHARNGRAEPARPVTRAAVAGQSTVIQPEAVMLNPADIPSWMGMAYFNNSVELADVEPAYRRPGLVTGYFVQYDVPRDNLKVELIIGANLYQSEAAAANAFSAEVKWDITNHAPTLQVPNVGHAHFADTYSLEQQAGISRRQTVVKLIFQRHRYVALLLRSLVPGGNFRTRMADSLVPLARMMNRRISKHLVRPFTVPAGRWNYTMNTSCAESLTTLQVCNAIPGATGDYSHVKGSTATSQEHASLTVDAEGRVTWSSSTLLVEHVRGATQQCSSKALDTAFDGSCRYSATGTGHVEVGLTGFPEWWLDSDTTTYYGTHVSHSTYHGLRDNRIPLSAGHWNTAQYLALLGFKSVPPGVTFQLAVTAG